MARPPAKRDVNLLRPGLRGAAPLKGAIDYRVHLIEPPARPRSAASAHNPARGCVALFQSKFHLCFHHAHRMRAGVGQIRGEAEEISNSKKQTPNSSKRRIPTGASPYPPVEFGFWNLEIIWNLRFEIWNSAAATTSPPRSPRPKPGPAKWTVH